MVQAFTNVGEAGDGGTSTPYVQTGSWVDLDSYLLTNGDGSSLTNVPAATVEALTPVSDDADNFAANFTGSNLKGGTFIANGDGGTAVLAAAATGQNYTIINGGANAVTLDPDSTGTEDNFVLVTPTGGYDATVAQGGTVSTSTSGAACVAQYLAADTILLFCDDNWAKD
jgi:hypothetical protein